MALERCVDCNASIKPDEYKCYACGTRVEGRRPSGSVSGFATFLTILFCTSAMITVASLFVAHDLFQKCLIATVALLVLRGTAGPMVSKKSS